MAVRFDDHLFTLLSSPRLWLGRVSARLGLARGKVAATWSLARQAEVYAVPGLDDGAILETIRKAGCEIVMQERASVPATRLAWWFFRLFGFKNMIRIMARKPST